MKKLVLVLTIAVLATGVVATKLWLDLRSEHGKAVEIQARLTAAQSKQLEQAAVPQSLGPAVPVIAVTAPQPAAAPAVVAAAPAAQPTATAPANTAMQGMLEAMATPEGQDATRAMMRGMMAQMYPDVAQELGLSEQEKEKLFDLLATEGLDSAGLMVGGAQDAAATREMQRRMVEAERAHEAKVSALLGSKYPNWEEYQGAAAARQQVDQLRRTLGASGNPLSEVQSKALATAFAAEGIRADKANREWSRSSAAINSPNMMQETIQRAVDTQNRFVDVAAPILDTVQLDRYRRQVEQQTTMLRATMGMMTGGGAP
jgi:hypothetical protein